MIPQRLGKFEIAEELGRGGFAMVYKAKDTTLDRWVALKVPFSHLASDPNFQARFEREARAAARLQHPNLVTIYEVGGLESYPYLAMEYVPGRTLAQILAERGALPLSEVVSIIGQVAEALDYAHRQGILHRDVKPSNVIIDERGRAYLTDFGLARAFESLTITSPSALLGTPHYLSPEQAEGRSLDVRSDIYSLGVVAYEMCVGRVPFREGSPASIIVAHLTKPPMPPRQLNPRLPRAVERVLLKALAKKLEERYSSATAFARALREAHEGKALPLRDAIPREFTAWIATLGFILLIGGAGA